MTRDDLVEGLLSRYPHLGRGGARRVVATILSALETALIEGRRVELRDFGIFERRGGAPRHRRNPATGETLAPRVDVRTHFRAGKGLTDRINAAPPSPEAT